MHEQHEYLTLTQAAKVAPGRPSANCMWRWCRKGVLARSGERVRLRHIRTGGKIFTTSEWVRDFGERLADADTRHFALDDDPVAPQPTRRHLSGGQERRANDRRTWIEQANRELKEAGL